MNKIKQWIASVLNHNKGAIAVVGAAVVAAAADQFKAGQINYHDLAGVALVATASIFRSSASDWLEKNLPATSTTPEDVSKS